MVGLSKYIHDGFFAIMILQIVIGSLNALWVIILFFQRYCVN